MNQKDIDTFLAQLSPSQETNVHLREAVGVLKDIQKQLVILTDLLANPPVTVVGPDVHHAVTLQRDPKQPRKPK